MTRIACSLLTKPGLVATLSLIAPLSLAYEPRTNYVLHCMGCHVEDGSGAPGKVPSMRETLAPLAATEEGRRYLIAVPGASQSPLSDTELADLLNWMIHNLSSEPPKDEVQKFTPAEVARSRSLRLENVAAIRAELLNGMAR